MMYVYFSVVCVLITFLWLTAISGTRFYEVSMSRRDIKTIKVLIHISSIILLLLVSYQIFVSKNYVEKMESKSQTIEVQAEPPKAER